MNSVVPLATNPTVQKSETQFPYTSEIEWIFFCVLVLIPIVIVLPL